MVKPIANQVNNPFQHIAEIEEYIKHLLHLCSVNTFMINHNRRYLYVLSYEQNAKEIDSSKSLEWNDIVSNDFHCQYIAFGGGIEPPIDHIASAQVSTLPLCHPKKCWEWVNTHQRSFRSTLL